LLTRYAKYTGLVIPKAETTVEELRRRVANMSGIDLQTVGELIKPYEKVYGALDYSKAIAFIVAEGVVPSNVKTGYLARLLIRRAYRLLMSLQAEERLLDLVDLQINFWRQDFPHLGEMRDEVLEIISHEVNKFKETIKRGTEAISREIKSAKQITVERLIQYYDDQGITPDIVADVAAKHGVTVEVPENFYELVASRHLREKPAAAEEKQTVDVSKYPPTVKLFYEHPTTYSFKAKVLGVEDNNIILDSTLFYPESGGAVGDTGTIVFGGEVCNVVDTKIVGDVILHRVEGKLPQVGEEVEGYVDVEKRLATVRHHTATHVLLGAVRRVLGKHAWQAGARKEPEKGRLDIYHHKRLTAEQIRVIENLANKIVARRIPIRISWMDRNEAEEIYGFGLYQGGEVPLGTIRVVEIPGWDAEACGGIHCENTEDVGLIKIVSSERIQDGVERIVFTAGPAALQRYQEIEAAMMTVAEKLRTPSEEVVRRVEELDEEVKTLRKTLKKFLEKIIVYKAAEIRSIALPVNKVLLYVSEEDYDDYDYLTMLAAETVKTEKPSVAFVYAGSPSAKAVCVCNEKAVELGVRAGEVVKKLLTSAGGGGGGSDSLGRGAAPRERLVSVIPQLEQLLRQTGGSR
ncbi:MAG: alanine--tRNA ligase-related protein, partial [Candidatus Caldarchaeum sp.]|nr:alanine--tRNA ligase-related protein [Candidatus Caldarchaeum sp.]MDW8435120.1 alanine--tRNA ligase-related protein [Candidatus Caldarchaeum sp.]